MDNDPVTATPIAFASREVGWISRYGLLMTIDPDHALKSTFYLYVHGLASPVIDGNGIIYISGNYNEILGIETRQRLATSDWPKVRGNYRNTGNLADNSM